jgi:hypothetical protein
MYIIYVYVCGCLSLGGEKWDCIGYTVTWYNQAISWYVLGIYHEHMDISGI